MLRLYVQLTLVLVLVLACSRPASAQFPDAKNPPPEGWTGPVFKLSQQYPKEPPAAEQFPWLAFDFKTQPLDYLKAVLGYCFEGNTDAGVDWAMDKKTAGRMWYHAPWMHDGDSGREFIHGLTKERTSRGGELHANQTAAVQNWAVSLYNPQGGFTIGQVWKDPNNPDATRALFPEGTVSVKLLFTEATDAAGPKQVPFLKGAKVCQADIFRTAKADGSGVGDMRLLQIDVAVRDGRANATTGWVFGTFIYNGDAAGASPYDRMIPVGLMWGNDPTLTPAKAAMGQKPQETVLNPAAKSLMTHYGLADRLNGPVDNKASSCLSCHSTAQVPSFAKMIPGSGDDVMNWFRNVKAGDPFESGAQSTDYSLQLSTGIHRFLVSNDHFAQAEVDGKPVLFTAQGRRVFTQTREGIEEVGTRPPGETSASGPPPPAAPAPTPASGYSLWVVVMGVFVGVVLGALGCAVVMQLLRKPA